MNLIRVLVLLSLVGLLACSSDDDPLPTADVDGVWTFTAGGSPPTLNACTGGIAGMSGLQLCAPFDLDLDQVGELATGGSTQDYCTFDYGASLLVSGNGIEGTVSMDDGVNPAQSFTFTGTVSGDSAILDPGTFEVEGQTGSCLISGSFSGTR